MTPPTADTLPNPEGDPIGSRLVIVGCSAEKVITSGPVSALDLYNGGCIPALRQRLGGQPPLRAQIRFLSAEHGLVTADTPLTLYDRPLTPARATQLRPQVTAALARDLTEDGGLRDVLVVAEPLYLVLLADLLALPARPRVHWIPDHAHGWPQARAVLDQWGW